MRLFTYKNCSFWLSTILLALPAVATEPAAPIGGVITPITDIFRSSPPMPPAIEECTNRSTAWLTGFSQAIDGRHWRVAYPRSGTSRPNPHADEHARLRYCNEYAPVETSNAAERQDRELNYFCCTQSYTAMELRIADKVSDVMQSDLDGDARRCLDDWMRGKEFAEDCMSAANNQVCESVDFSQILLPGCFSHGFAANYPFERLVARRSLPPRVVSDSVDSGVVRTTEGFWFDEPETTGVPAPSAR